MAQALPSAKLDYVLKQLKNPIFHNNKLHIQLRDIRSKLELIKDVIDDAELMGILFPDAVGKWVCEFQDLLYEVDDLFDEAVTRSLSRSGLVENIRVHLYNLSFGFTMAPKMKRINKRLDSIVEKCYECNLIEKRNEKPIPRKGVLRYNPKCVEDDDEFQMIGRADDKEKVIKMLVGKEASQAVVWVIGEAGVGKTTLCRSVYIDEQVRSQFDIVLWVGGLTDFSSLELSTKMARIIKVGEPVSVENIVSKISKMKVLLILDSVPYYMGVEEFWSVLEKMIAANGKGSKILISSLKNNEDLPLRHPEIGASFHRLRNDVLSKEQMWSIFEKTALVSSSDERMRELGEKIVSRCLGNPSLLRGVGTLLYGKSNRDIWEEFAGFDFESRYRDYTKISEVCQLLPKCHHHVGYMSLFSKHGFEYGDMLRQFEAHGLTDLSDTMQRRLKDDFLYKEDDDWNSMPLYVIKPECKDQLMQPDAAEWTKDELLKGARHVSIVRSPPSTYSSSTQDTVEKLPYSLIKDAMHRRSLLFLGKFLPRKMSVETLDTLASNLRCLRVLNLQHLGLDAIPSSLGKLIHLRYLDLSHNDFQILPDSICMLKKLQTLKLINCILLLELPRRINNLSHLEHLEIDKCFNLTHMPSEIARLTGLKKLDRFMVDRRKGRLRYLENLDSLSGRLSIEIPRQWEESVADAEKAKLDRKKGLTALEFKWEGIDDVDENNNDEAVLQKLEPCTSLEVLFITDFAGKKLPDWITSLGCLTQIIISQCKQCETLPPFHEKPRLKSLTLASLDVKYIQDKSCIGDVFFPSLEKLSIGFMPNLKRFLRNSGCLKTFPVINTLDIWDCPRLTTSHPFSKISDFSRLSKVSVKTLQSIDCDKIRIFSIQDMISLPNQLISKLPSKLEIKNCYKLQMLWADEVEATEAWESLPEPEGFQRRLTYLEILDCYEMKYLSHSLRRLTHLESLRLCGCSRALDCLYKEEEEDGMPWKALQSLRYLKIKGFDNLAALPKGLRQLPLVEFKITSCESLKWEAGSLPKIERFAVKDCPHFSLVIEELQMEHPYVEVY